MERGDVPGRGIQRLGYTENPRILTGCWTGSGWGFRQGDFGGKWSAELMDNFSHKGGMIAAFERELGSRGLYSLGKEVCGLGLSMLGR